METIVKHLDPFLLRYNEEINREYAKKKYHCDILFRRGFCGTINNETVFNNLIKDLNLKKEDVTNTINNKEYDIYHSSVPHFYLKTLCICDLDCNSKCCKNGYSNNCDGHRIFLISLNNNLEINDDDYVVDFTYKQMIYGPEEETVENNRIAAQALPDYLFMSFLDYINYSTNDRWKENIKKPCRRIIDHANNLRLKYLKYKNKYIALKKLVKANTFI